MSSLICLCKWDASLQNECQCAKCFSNSSSFIIGSFSEERPESWAMRGTHKLLEDTVWSSLWCTVTSILLAGSQDEMTFWSHSSHLSFTEQRTVHISRAEDEALPGISRLLIYILSQSFHAIHSLPVHLLFFLLTDVVDWCTSDMQNNLNHNTVIHNIMPWLLSLS